MNITPEWQLPLSLLLACAGPVLALRYLRSILLEVLAQLCQSQHNAEFWWRTINVLALCGSLMLVLFFVPKNDSVGLNELLRHSLLLVALSVFFSVAIVARRIVLHIGRQDLHTQAAARIQQALAPQSGARRDLPAAVAQPGTQHPDTTPTPA